MNPSNDGSRRSILTDDGEASMRLSKPIYTAPELLNALENAKEVWRNMTPEEKEAMLQKQRESWTRQDMD